MSYLTRRFIFVTCILLLLTPLSADAQYKGLPVQRDRLIQVLRSKQFQTRDIVQIINENGVDFKLTPATENELVAAGARPPVLEAVKRSYRADTRPPSKGGKNTAGTIPPVSNSSDYGSLLSEAVEAYDIQKNPQAALTLLNRAVQIQPNNPRAYQLLGFVSLYSRHNFDDAETYWKKSISLGGNAVLRVIHDHNGTFTQSCEGSLYISKNIVRFESDNNGHTFETSDRNIKKIEVNSKLKRIMQMRGGSFKIVLDKEDHETNYNFAPLSGKTDESKMIIRLIGK